MFKVTDTSGEVYVQGHMIHLGKLCSRSHDTSGVPRDTKGH